MRKDLHSELGKVLSFSYSLLMARATNLILLLQTSRIWRLKQDYSGENYKN